MDPAALLSLIVFLPAAGAVLTACAPAAVARWIGLGTVAATFLLTTAALLPAYFEATPDDHGMRLVTDAEWVGSFNIRYTLGVDGISLPLVVLTGLVFLLSAATSWNVSEKPRAYWSLFLLLETGVLGTFLALDLFLFYVLFEVMLLPMYFLIGVWGGPNRAYAAIKFFLYTLAGSLLLLVALLMLYAAGGSGVGASTFDMRLLSDIARGAGTGEYAGVTIDRGTQTLAFWLMLGCFLIKLPAVPFHTWLPDAHVEAPTPVSMILAGVLLKVGGYGILRLAYPLAPLGAAAGAEIVCALGAVSIIYGALAAMAQTDFKRLVAYSSVSHMGYVLLGLGAWTLSEPDFWKMGFSGAIFQMVGHGITSTGMFFAVGVLYDRVHHREINRFGGLLRRMPIYAALGLGMSFAALGLPGLCGFVGEAVTVFAAWPASPWAAAAAAFGIILTAGYMLRMVQRVFLGAEYVGPLRENLSQLSGRETAIFAVLMALAVALGVYPRPVFDVTEPAVGRLVDTLGDAVEADRERNDGETVIAGAAE
ncbi:complex I subunit 4 family protein [Alienimonas chondri]|uniref:NADH-quinone oxidoreductase subunit M n=1 Tax=Alienimonas chondri TaxID=2681879 RepID=A0ABX1VGX5_9PLAN|nr:NADH-quinone oxidoreductase subunit M [Alienimonas chondri]NNJ26706.1 NADH-quinone oxidoreductase subunit M [Alienimonas chondri]